MPLESKPLVAIVGRPNVGKSTLFNRIAGQRKAIVSGTAGTTRDRVTTDSHWGNSTFMLVDTGGLDLFPSTEMEHDVKSQIEVAVEEADVIIMLVDAHIGITTSDQDVADKLRPIKKPVILAANKADNRLREANALDFYELGLGEPIPISAYHNSGIDDLMTNVIVHFPTESPLPMIDTDLRMAIVGRTNVGKSMLLNSITRQERAIVNDSPGTTRDPLDTHMTYNGQEILIIDTAGIRRRGKISPGVERYSALRAIRAIDRTDVAILVMDASELATAQDSHIVSYILDSYKGVLLAINKWDLAPEMMLSKEKAANTVRERFKFAPYAPICYVSALQHFGIESLMDKAQIVASEWNKTLPRYGLKRAILDALSRNPPPSAGRHAIKVYGVTQDQASPPSFTFYVNRSDMVHFSYRRYLENTLRQAYGFHGTPLKVRFKGRGEK